MSFSLDDVTKIAELARLAMTDEEQQRYAHSLNDILAMIDHMNNVDTSSISPLANPLGATQRLRQDNVTETDQRGLYQSVAPLTEAGLYLVPQIIE